MADETERNSNERRRGFSELKERSPSESISSTLEFYEAHAKRYFDDTVVRMPTESHDAFLCELAAKACILDAGCGSGRDARRFRELGYCVEAFDASPRLASLASEHAGIPVEVLRFEDYDTRPLRYDGIWAFASLLHVGRSDLPAVIGRLAASLRPGGVLFASFKIGPDQTVDDKGRTFTNLSPVSACHLVQNEPLLELRRLWREVGQASLGATADWLYLIAKRDH